MSPIPLAPGQTQQRTDTRSDSLAQDLRVLATDLARAGRQIPEAALERLGRYVCLLEQWNRRINLVGSTLRKDLLQRQILECLWFVTLPQIKQASMWVDLGSGAGLPALPLAILHPETPVYAVERVARKATFQWEVARQLELHNVHILRIDLRTAWIERDLRAPLDEQSFPLWGRVPAVVARACAPLERLLPLVRPLLAPGGTLWVFRRADAFIGKPGCGRKQCWESEWGNEIWEQLSLCAREGFARPQCVPSGPAGLSTPPPVLLVFSRN